MPDQLPRLTIVLSAEGHLRYVFTSKDATLAVTREEAGPRKDAVYSDLRPIPLCPEDEIPAALQDRARTFHYEQARLFSSRNDEPAKPVTDALSIGLAPAIARRFTEWCAKRAQHPGKKLEYILTTFLRNHRSDP